MSRNSWKAIRSTAAPDTIARAELKTAALLVSLDRQGQADDDAMEDPNAETDEKDKPRG